jgi:hypothetical protein
MGGHKKKLFCQTLLFTDFSKLFDGSIHVRIYPSDVLPEKRLARTVFSQVTGGSYPLSIMEARSIVAHSPQSWSLPRPKIEHSSSASRV